MLRHLVGRDNLTRQGLVADPRRVRHGLIAGRRVEALAGEVDPLTHLNLDFPGHRLDSAIVVERLEVGAAVPVDGDGFMVAPVDDRARRRLGRVDLGGRRLDWQLALRRR